MPWAERIIQQILSWPDTHQLTVFGRYGYYFHNYLFATVPTRDELLEIWVRLNPEDAEKILKSPQASRHIHPVEGWMRFRVDEDGQIQEALSWIERAYKTAEKYWSDQVDQLKKPSPEGGSVPPLGVPIQLVPEATGKPDHKIPQGPSSDKFASGLAVKGAAPQPPQGRGAIS